MPSRRKAKQAKKMRSLTTTNHHSSPTVQSQGKCDLKSLKEENGSLRVGEEKGKIKGNSLSAGAAISASHSKMEGSFNGTLEETQKVESLSEENEVAVEEIKSSFDFGGEDAADDKSKSLSETQDGDSTFTDEQATQGEENRELVDSGKEEKTEDVAESVVSFDPIGSPANDLADARKAPVDNLLPSDTVELKLKEEQEKDFLSSEDADVLSPVVANDEVKEMEETELPPSDENIELSSVSGNEGLRETEGVETITDLTGADEIKLPSSEKNGLSSVVTDGTLRESEETNGMYINSFSSLPRTDVASKETLETTIPKSDDSGEVPPTITDAVPKGTEESWLPSTDEKVGEPSDVQEPSKESANKSFQPSANVPAAETTVQDKTEIPRSTENPTIVHVTQWQYTSWRSCCGLFEILRHGDR